MIFLYFLWNKGKIVSKSVRFHFLTDRLSNKTVFIKKILTFSGLESGWLFGLTAYIIGRVHILF